MANLSNINNKFLVTTGGNVLIGTTADNGSGILQLSGAAVSQYITSTSGSQATLFIGRSSDTQAKFTSGDVAASDLCLYTGGSRRLVILSSGNVGIGTDSPAGKVEVLKNGGTSDIIATSDTLALLQLKDSGLTKHYNIEIGRSASAGDLTFRSVSGEKVRFTEGGNVGIGTGSPGTYKLNVAGTGLFTGGLEMAAGGAVYQGQKFYLDGGGDTFLESPSSNLMTFTTGGTERMRINSGGNVGIGVVPVASSGNIRLDVGFIGCGITSRQNAELVLTANADYTTATTTGRAATMLNLTNTGEFYFSTAPAATAGTALTFTTRMAILSGGNVGIGTTGPGSKLHVESLGAGNANGTCVYLHGDTPTNFPVMRIDNATGGNATDTHGLLINNTAPGAALRINNGSNTALTVKGNGNIGIGGLAATAKLQVNATPNAGAGSIAAFLVNSSITVGTEVRLAFAANTNDDIATNRYSYISTINTSGSNGQDMLFATNTTGNPAVERMRITSTGEANFVKNVNTQLNFHATGGTPSLRLTDSFGSGGQLADFAIEVYNGDFEIKDKKNSNLSRFRIANNGSIFALGLGGTAASNSDVRYSTANGELYYQQSSKRYKTNIVNLENSLDKINSLRPVRYNDIKTNEPACGLIAEETVKIIPEVVFNKEIEGFDKPQIEGINYTDLVPYLIKSIQELKAEIELLKAK